MILVHDDRNVREFFDGSEDEMAQKRSGLRICARPAEACTMTGLSVAAAPSMIARICSRLLTLNAGTP